MTHLQPATKALVLHTERAAADYAGKQSCATRCFASCVQSVTIPASAGSARRKAEGAVLASQRGVIFDSCGPDLFTRVTVGTMVGIALLYFAATCALLLWKLNRHKRMPYRQTQVGTVFFRLQVSSQDLTGQLCFCMALQFCHQSINL